MPDRIIREELFESVRWLDLPTDTHRLAYIGLVSTRADDYGNLEGGPRRLYRWMHQFTQIKSDADSIKIMSELADADMVRRYEVDGFEYWHLPRFKNSRRYWSRKCPRSPFDEQQQPTSVENQSVAKNPTADLPQTSHSPSRGVGVGVGVKKSKSLPPNRASRPPDGVNILAALGVDQQIATDWLAVRKAKRAGPITQSVVDALSREAANAGISVAESVRIAAERGWQGFKASWIKPGDSEQMPAKPRQFEI